MIELKRFAFAAVLVSPVLACAAPVWAEAGSAPDRVGALAKNVVAIADNNVKWGQDSGLPPSLIVGKTARWVLIAVDKAQLPGADERAALDLAARSLTSDYSQAAVDMVRKQIAEDK